ncbi:unnamed protein product [Orchesella dallaii]|uniref:Rab-GAP TBC domain-containing protein n=1 Tax=Orchesella dallaii TaxID=48710 RepID=A0ABP1PV50_9HEXA
MITVPLTGYSPYHTDDISQNPYRQTLAKWGKATSVSEVMSTMKESTKVAVNGSPGAGIGSAMRSASASMVTDLSDVPTDAITFEVLYTGKLRMSSRKAPPSFIDDALAKFKCHETEKGRRGSVAISYSRRSSSQESSSDIGGSSDSLQMSIVNKALATLANTIEDNDVFHDANKASLKNTIITVTETSENMETEIDKTPTGSRSPSCMDDNSAMSDVPDAEGLNEDHDPAALKSCLRHPLEDMDGVKMERTRTPSGDSYLVKSMSLPVEPMRNRALSTGNYPRNNDLESHRSESQYNRTMILIVGKNELRIISPDAKSLLFSKHFRDIYHSSQGIENKEYFGFICRENAGSVSSSGKPSGGGYVAYVFRCESDAVAGDILKVLKQAYIVNHENLKKERQIQSCDHCPMVWYRQLCNEVDGIPCDEKIKACILKNINGLPDEDRQNILAKFHGAEPQTVQEQNELLMMLLRAHCECKQAKHIHDTAENRHEFLSQYLGGGAILMKAKRSISNSFDHLIKRKGRDGIGLTREASLPYYSTPVSKEICGNPSGGRVASVDNSPVSKTPGEREHGSEDGLYSMVVSDSPLENIPRRPRSSTVGALTGEKIRCEIRNRISSQGFALSPSSSRERSPTLSFKGNGESGLSIPTPRNSSMGSKEQKQHSPMMNIFLKVGTQNKPSPEASGKTVRRSGSWRHAIFKRVVSPSTPESGRGTPVNYPASTPVSSRSSQFRQKRSKREIRELWKSAINQQIILIRMEKQNLRLKAKQQEADVKRLKLSYQELGTCDEEASDTWDLIMSQSQSNPSQKCDIQLLNSAILRGIPKHKRGQVWQFFMQQRRMGHDQPNNATSYSHINLDIPYEHLLRQLTSQQHAILIDLGRTFPSHQYFSSPLGSGQLALFNILKAYSLLDTDVGYCQGLSFVVGLLLMHYEEEDAFSVLKYMMFDLGAREHYKPDMLGLQVKLYQLTRLIHDQDPDIQLLLYHNDVLPSLYAAPWFLTMFASQFQVGFAVRVLDLVMLHGVDVIAKFALAIVLDHKKELMQCNGLEQVMECFKTVVTQITSTKLDRYLRKVIDAEWDKQMLTYAVEYSVMNDEAFNTFLSESSAPQMPVRLQKSVTLENKMVQTETSRETSPTNTGESHPILGELIQRQNSEISKLKQDKADLRKDIQTLLSCVLTMQKLAKISSKGAICPPVPPQVHDIASKYVTGGANYFSSMMENGWSSSGGENNSTSGHTRETLNVVDEYEERTGSDGVQSSRLQYGSISREHSPSVRGSILKNSSARGFGVEDNGSSHGIPPLDQDSDDNSSDHSSHHITFEKGGPSRVGIRAARSNEKLSQNNNGLNDNKISTIFM